MIIWDFTCSDTLCQGHILFASLEAGKAAEKAESRKHITYQELKTTYTFVPIALETLGAWGKEGLKFVKDLGSRIAEVTGEKRSTNYLFQTIGIANQRGNAISISANCPKC